MTAALERERSSPLGTCCTQRPRWTWGCWLLCSFTFVVVLSGTGYGELPSPTKIAPSERRTQEPLTPIPAVVTEDSRHVQLGERLFYDPRLSQDNRQSCATCHPLDRGGMDGRPRAVDLYGQARLRNTPTIFNVGLNFWFNWDGATHTLAAHADKLLRNPAVMNTTWPELQEKLTREGTYVAAFRAAYRDGLTWRNVIAALVSFERSLTTPHSRFDAYLSGDRQALTEDEQHGYGLFKSYGCVACHQGMNIGGNMFAKLGVFRAPDGASEEAVDKGRYIAIFKCPRPHIRSARTSRECRSQ